MGFLKRKSASSTRLVSEQGTLLYPLEETIKHILQINPHAAQRAEPKHYHRLPLHCACRSRGTDPRTVQALLEAYPQAAATPDAMDRVPLHYALLHCACLESTSTTLVTPLEYQFAVSIVEMLLRTCPLSARQVDWNGWTPLHVACHVGASKQVVEQILQLYPDAAVMCTDKLSSATALLPRHCRDYDEIQQLLLLLSTSSRQFGSPSSTNMAAPPRRTTTKAAMMLQCLRRRRRPRRRWQQTAIQNDPRSQNGNGGLKGRRRRPPLVQQLIL